MSVLATGVMVALVAGGGALLSANLYIQSARIQNRIRLELSEAFHMPTQIRKVSFTPWNGLQIRGVTTSPSENSPQLQTLPNTGSKTRGAVSPNSDSLQLSVRSFRARIALWPLFTRRTLQVEEIILDQPYLYWAQGVDGRWRWPQSDVAKRTERGSLPQRATEVSVQDTQVNTQPAAPEGEVALRGRKVRLNDGNVELLDSRGAKFATLGKIRFEGYQEDRNRYQGQLHIDAISIYQRLNLNKFSAALDWRPEAIRFTDGRASLGGGQIAVEYSVHPNEPGSPFEAHAHGDNVSLGEILESAGFRSDLAEGNITGDVTASGLLTEVTSRPGMDIFRFASPRCIAFRCCNRSVRRFVLTICAS